MLMALFVLTESGPGRISLDAARRHERKGAGWAVSAIAAGAVGSHLAILAGGRSRRPAENVPESPQGDSLRRAA
jgi:putative oxidoreductase